MSASMISPPSAPLSARRPTSALYDAAPLSPAVTNMRKSERIMSRREIEGMIASGHLLVVLEGYVLKMDKWIERHPGGQLPILHMVGTDATSEIAA